MRAYRRYVGHRIVAQVGEDSIEGELSDVSGGVLTLIDASLLGPRPTPLDGAVLVPLPVRWLQVAS